MGWTFFLTELCPKCGSSTGILAHHKGPISLACDSCHTVFLDLSGEELSHILLGIWKALGQPSRSWNENDWDAYNGTADRRRHTSLLDLLGLNP